MHACDIKKKISTGSVESQVAMDKPQLLKLSKQDFIISQKPAIWKKPLLIAGGVTAAEGFKAAGMYGGLRALGPKPDLALVTCDVAAVAAGTFTKNVVAAAPVHCKSVSEKIKTARAVLINAGQANAATGDAGNQDVIDCSNALSKLLQVSPHEILTESTGVIGQRIKKEPLLSSLPKLISLLSPNVEGYISMVEKGDLPVSGPHVVGLRCSSKGDITAVYEQSKAGEYFVFRPNDRIQRKFKISSSKFKMVEAKLSDGSGHWSINGEPSYVPLTCPPGSSLKHLGIGQHDNSMDQPSNASVSNPPGYPAEPPVTPPQ